MARILRCPFPNSRPKTHYDLKPKLKDLGITLIFGGGDFSGISDTDMFVDKAVQDAYVNVNEEGNGGCCRDYHNTD